MLPGDRFVVRWNPLRSLRLSRAKHNRPRKRRLPFSRLEAIEHLEDRTLLAVSPFDDVRSDPGELFVQAPSPVGGGSGGWSVGVDGFSGELSHVTPLLTPTGAAGLTPGLALAYHSEAAEPNPIIAVETSVLATASIPDSVEAKLTFQGNTWTTWYDTANLAPGDPVRFAFQIDAAGIASGRYAYQIDLISHYGGETATSSYSGYKHIVNRTGGEFGGGWALVSAGFSRESHTASEPGFPETLGWRGLERIFYQDDGVLHVRGDGSTTFFAGSGGPFCSASVFDFIEGVERFAVMDVDTCNNTATFTDKFGYQSRFNSDGLLTSHEDNNGNVISYSYGDFDGDFLYDELDAITDAFGRTIDFAYSGGLVSSITDIAGRVVSLAHSGGNLTGLTLQDPDDTGPEIAPNWSYSYQTGTSRLSAVTDPLSRAATTIAYDAFHRADTVTWADNTSIDIDPAFTVGLVDPASGQGTQSNPAPIYEGAADEWTFFDELDRATVRATDGFGRPLSITAADGTLTTLQRNAHGLVTQRTDPDPDGGGSREAPVTQFQWDSSGNLTQITWADGNTSSWTYDAAWNRPASFTDQRLNTWSWSWDAATGNLLSATDPLSNTTDYAWTSRGLLQSTTLADPDGTGPLGRPTTTLSRDTYGRVTQRENADLTTVAFTYDSADNLLTVTDELGRVTTHEYDDLDRRVKTTMPDPDGAGELGATVYTTDFDAADRIESETISAVGGATSFITAFAYDARDRLVTKTLPDPDGEGWGDPSPVWQWTYDAAGNRLTEVDPKGNTTSWAFDSMNRVLSVTDPADNQTTFTYSDLGELLTVTDPLLNQTSHDYDVMSRLSATTDAENGVWSFSYFADGTLQSETDPLNRSTSHQRNALGLITQTTDPAGGTIQYEYDNLGRLSAVVDQSTARTEYTRDIMGRVSDITDDLGGVESFTYTAAGERETASDPMNRTTTWVRDGLGRVIEVRDPANNSTFYAYDILNDVVKITDALNNVTLIEHDNLGRTVKTTDAEAGETIRTWDAASNLKSITDPVGNTTEFFYDARNLLIQETNSLASSRHWSYDAGGAVSSTTDRLGRVREFSRDGLSRVTAEDWRDTAGGPVVHSISYTWDAASQLTGISDANASYAFTYNNMGLVTQSDNFGTPNVPHVVLDATYDAVGNRTQLKATIAGTADFQNDYTFDALGRMTRVQQTSQTGGNSVADKRVDLAWNAAGQFTQLDRYEDLAATQLVASSSYGYDTVGRLSSLSHDKGANNLASYTWTFDAANRITQMTTIDGTASYSYDKTHQLLSASYGGSQPDETHSWDANGNSTLAGWQTGTNNRVLSDGTHDYLWDAEGNLIKKTTIATGDYVEYAWDHHNRLVSVSFRDSAGALTKRVEYEYDPFDRLIARRVDDDGNGTFERGQRFVYDALVHPADVADRQGAPPVVLVFDESGSFESRKLPGPAVDQLFADEDALGEILWPLADHQQSVRDLVDYDAGTDTSAVVNHLKYNTFGEIVEQSDPTKQPLFAFTGRFFDQDADLQYNWHRWYDPQLKRWISEDPIGFEAGDANLQRYVGNSPASLIDPSGLVDPGSPFPGGGLNPLNWPFQVTYGASKLYHDWKYDNFGRELELRGKQAELDARYQSRDRMGEDDIRRAMRRQNRKPIPPTWNEHIQNAEAAVAGNYGQPLGMRPSPFQSRPHIRPAVRPHFRPSHHSRPNVRPGVGYHPPAYPSAPDVAPGPGWEWRGKPPVGGNKGSWYKPSTGESFHPDLGHPDPIGPHYDWIDPDGKKWRVFPDGRVEAK